MSDQMDQFMYTIMQKYQGTVKNSIQEATAMNTRNIASMQGITSNLNEKDLSKLGPQLSNFFPDANEMEAAITCGNKLLAVSRQLEAIKQKTGASDKEALKIREEMGRVIAKHADKEKQFHESKIKLLHEELKKMDKEIAKNKTKIEFAKSEISLCKSSKDLSEQEKKDSIKSLERQIRTFEKNKKSYELKKKESIEEERKHTSEKNRYTTIKKNHEIETKALKVIDKQLVSARSMVKAQLAVNVARGKMTMKDAAVGLYKTGGSPKDIVDVAMKAAFVKTAGETAFKMLNQGKDIRTAAGEQGKPSRIGLGYSLQAFALIVGAAHTFVTIISKGAVIIGQVLNSAINLASKSFSGGIEGVMRGTLDIMAAGVKGIFAGLAAGAGLLSPGLAEGSSMAGKMVQEILQSAGGLLIQVRMFNMEQEQFRAQQKYAVYGRAGRYGEEDNSGLPPSIMNSWVNALAQQAVTTNATRKRLMDRGMSMGMDAGETASNFGAMRDVTNDVSTALKNLDKNFLAARNSARGTNLAVTVFTDALNKAGVAARYMQVDFNSMSNLMMRLVGKGGSGQGLFAAFGQNIKTDLATILEQAASYGKGWSDTKHAYAGQMMFGGEYKGDIIGGMQASRYGKLTADVLAKEGWAGVAEKFAGKDNKDFTSNLNAQKMWAAATTAKQASAGKTGAEAAYLEEKAMKDIFGDISPVLMAKIMQAYQKSGGVEGEFANQIQGAGGLDQLNEETMTANQILSETNKIEIESFKVQKVIGKMVSKIFDLLSGGNVLEAAKEVTALTTALGSYGMDLMAGKNVDSIAVPDLTSQREKFAKEQADLKKYHDAASEREQQNKKQGYYLDADKKTKRYIDDKGRVLQGEVNGQKYKDGILIMQNIESGAGKYSQGSKSVAAGGKATNVSQDQGKTVNITFSGPIYNRSALDQVLSEMSSRF